MVLLVFVHGYNLDVRYMQPWTIPGQQLNFTSFTEYFLANGIFRFRIPMLFIISGYLFAMHDQKPNRIRNRMKTLLVPYLLWSAIGIVLTYILELSVPGREMVSGSHILQIDENRFLLHDYRWYETLGKWLFFPVPYQLWFIRVLFIYNLAYPAIRWCVLHPKGKWIFFSIAAIMWLGTMGLVLIEGEGLLFFSLGVWMQKTRFQIDARPHRIKPLWWCITFVGMACIKTILAFLGEPFLGGAVYPVLTLLHKFVVLSGLIACWYGLDKLVGWCMDNKWFVWLSAFSFMIYAMHAPLVAFLIDPVLHLLGPLPGAHLAAFFILPLALIIVIITLSAITRKYLPGLYRLLTGGRGMPVRL
jgi:fucose 4-O-acetylase-like acetyltransferase